MHRTAAILAILGLGAGLTAAPPVAKSRNESIEISATAYLSKDEIRSVVGEDLPPGIIVLEVSVSAVTDQPISVYRDDFTLLCFRGGQRSQPYSPSQIAGSGTMVVAAKSSSGTPIYSQGNGPVWGGMDGRPRRMGGDGAMLGSGSSGVTNETRQMDTKEKESPLLKRLKELDFAEGEIPSDRKGYLFFALEGKAKAKDLTLQFKGLPGRVNLEFR